MQIILINDYCLIWHFRIVLLNSVKWHLEFFLLFPLRWARAWPVFGAKVVSGCSTTDASSSPKRSRRTTGFRTSKVASTPTPFWAVTSWGGRPPFRPSFWRTWRHQAETEGEVSSSETLTSTSGLMLITLDLFRFQFFWSNTFNGDEFTRFFLSTIIFVFKPLTKKAFFFFLVWRDLRNIFLSTMSVFHGFWRFGNNCLTVFDF